MPSSPYKAKPQLLGSSASSPTSKFIAASAHPSSAGASFGRITSVRLRAGCRRAPQTLIGQLTQRQYHYDALGQLSAIAGSQGQVLPFAPTPHKLPFNQTRRSF